MMMSLGMFVFGLPTFAYQQLERRCSWRHADNGRVGARAASQFLGPGEDCIELSGLLYPHLVGDAGSFKTLRDMGDAGDALPLVDGEGQQLGIYVITDVRETQDTFLENGQPLKYDFRLSLKAVDADDQAQTGAQATPRDKNGNPTP